MAAEKKIVCFGDSNTWGACGFSAVRRDKDRRWTGIIDMMPGYHVVNYGENGRDIPHDKYSLKAFETMAARESPFDLLIIMLGTNDLLTMRMPDADIVSERIRKFLKDGLQIPAISGDASKIFLIAPPRTGTAGEYGDARYDEASAKLGESYVAIAKELGVNFADASEWGIQTGPDGVHFTEEGHRVFARGAERELSRIFHADAC